MDKAVKRVIHSKKVQKLPELKKDVTNESSFARNSNFEFDLDEIRKKAQTSQSNYQDFDPRTENSSSNQNFPARSRTTMGNYGDSRENNNGTPSDEVSDFENQDGRPEGGAADMFINDSQKIIEKTFAPTPQPGFGFQKSSKSGTTALTSSIDNSSKQQTSDAQNNNNKKKNGVRIEELIKEATDEMANDNIPTKKSDKSISPKSPTYPIKRKRSATRKTLSNNIEKDTKIRESLKVDQTLSAVMGEISRLRSMHTVDVSAKVTEVKGEIDEVIGEMSTHCNDIDKSMKNEIEKTFLRAQEGLLNTFLTISKSIVAEVFSKALPASATIVNGGLNSVKMRQAIQKENMIKKKYMQNAHFAKLEMETIAEAIDKTVSLVFSEFIQRLSELNEETRSKVAEVQDKNELLSSHINELQNENIEMIKKMEKIETSLEKEKEINRRLQNEFAIKERQMDLMKDQINRRNAMLDEQRTAYHNEILDLQTQLLNSRKKDGESSDFAQQSEDIHNRVMLLREKTKKFAKNSDKKEAIAAYLEKLQVPIGSFFLFFLVFL